MPEDRQFDRQLSDDTVPTPHRAKGANFLKSPITWILTLGIALPFMAIALALVLIPLRLPPPSPSPGYEAFSSNFFGEVGVQLDPSKDHLLQTEDGMVTVYVPVAAYAGGGFLIMQPRDPQMIPERVDESSERVLAVDLLLIGADGQIIERPLFDPALLLCFHTRGLETQAELAIQRYDRGWNDLPTGPGWESSQVCATLDHLSIIALTVRHPPPTATVEGSQKAQPTPTTVPTLAPYSPLDR